MLSRQVVSSVEIGMLEDLDCKGEAYHNEFAKELDYEMKKKLRFTFSTGYALRITRKKQTDSTSESLHLNIKIN